MSTSTIPAVLDALVAALALRSGLVGVGVWSAPAGDSKYLENIEFGAEIDIDQSSVTMGGGRQETYRIDGGIGITKAGAGEDTIKAARDRCFALLAELEAYLNDNPTIGGTCMDADLDTGQMKQGYQTNGRTCSVEFAITVRAFINP